MELIFLTAILGATIILAVYIAQLFKSKPVEKTEVQVADVYCEQEAKEEKEMVTAKSKKKHIEKKIKEKAPTFQHPWLVTSLKGHSGKVLDLDFSPNGKYLASSGEVCIRVKSYCIKLDN